MSDDHPNRGPSAHLHPDLPESCSKLLRLMPAGIPVRRPALVANANHIQHPLHPSWRQRPLIDRMCT